jgi:hypothetical protein
MGRELRLPLFGLSLPMFNFSANHLFLLSRTEYRTCAVFLMLDRDTQRVYRLLDFTKRLRLLPDKAYCAAGKVNSVNTLFLVIESVKLDTKHRWSSNAPAPPDGAGGQSIE